MEHAQHARVEVRPRARRAVQLAVGQPQRERVDREVAPREVVLERRAELHDRQRAGLGIALAPRSGEVERGVRASHRGRAEALVHQHLAAEPLGRPARDDQRVPLDDEVEVARHAAEQQVAHRAADHPDARLSAQRREHRLGRGQGPESLQEGRRHAGNLEGDATA